MTSRKQKTLRINSVSADITRVPRPPKSTHHHECKPKSELRVKNLTTLEKPPKKSSQGRKSTPGKNPQFTNI